MIARDVRGKPRVDVVDDCRDRAVGLKVLKVKLSLIATRTPTRDKKKIVAVW